jgi:hypothetical protein
MNSVTTHPKPRVLGIGIDPIFGDVSTLPPGLTPEVIRATIDAQIEGLRTLGYEAESCLVDLGESAEQTVESVLRSRTFDCIVIGAGLRASPERLMLFEKIITCWRRRAGLPLAEPLPTQPRLPSAGSNEAIRPAQVATEDKIIPPAAQRQMAKRAGATVEETAGSHAIYIRDHPVHRRPGESRQTNAE